MRTTKPTTLDLGSVSCATMRPEDLIPVFLDLATSLRLSRSERRHVAEITRAAEQEEYYRSDDAADEDLATLFDVLEAHTPDYTYFGAHPGDGADYGVWPVQDLFLDRHEGGYDGYVSMTGRDAAKPDHTHALEFTDHGNATLYRRIGKRNQWKEVWSVV
jgi:hypothetical protein